LIEKLSFINLKSMSVWFINYVSYYFTKSIYG